MKEDRSLEMVRLTSNLELILQNDAEKMIAFTSDTTKCDVQGIINELASIFAVKNKVAVLSYLDEAEKIDGVDYIVVDALKDNKESIDAKCEAYDIVFIHCPNMLLSKSYLHMAEYARELVIVAKKWKSKINNINNIKALAGESNIDIIGIVYEK